LRVDGAIGTEHIKALIVVAVHEHRDALVCHRLYKSVVRYDRASPCVQVEIPDFVGRCKLGGGPEILPAAHDQHRWHQTLLELL